MFVHLRMQIVVGWFEFDDFFFLSFTATSLWKSRRSRNPTRRWGFKKLFLKVSVIYANSDAMWNFSFYAGSPQNIVGLFEQKNTKHTGHKNRRCRWQMVSLLEYLMIGEENKLILNDFFKFFIGTCGTFGERCWRKMKNSRGRGWPRSRFFSHK